MGEAVTKYEFPRADDIGDDDGETAPPGVQRLPFGSVVEAVRGFLNVPIVRIALVDLERHWFETARGLAAPQTPAGDDFGALAMRARGPLVIPDLAEDARTRHHPQVRGMPHLRSCLGVPIKADDDFNVGALCALDLRPRHYLDRQIAMMQNLAEILLDEIDLIRAATVDPLTSLPNRRAFFDKFEVDPAEVLARDPAARPSGPAACFIVDVDRMERINQVHGHDVGDQVLVAVAGLLMSWKQPGETVARIASDEFACVCPGLDARAGIAHAESLQRLVAASSWPFLPETSVTVSIGVATVKSLDVAPSEWLAAADRATYEAKLYGRNRVVLAEDVAGAARTPLDMPTLGRRRVRDLPRESEMISPMTLARWVNNIH